jgi:hypothetical protein
MRDAVEDALEDAVEDAVKDAFAEAEDVFTAEAPKIAPGPYSGLSI